MGDRWQGREKVRLSVATTSMVARSTWRATTLHQGSQDPTQIISGVSRSVSGIIGVATVVVVTMMTTGMMMASVSTRLVAIRGYRDVWCVLECVASTATEGVCSVAKVG